VIRDVDEYAHVFWIDDIPRQRGCFARAWGDNADFSEDVWIEVRNQREPELPRVPPLCEEWVDRSALLNKEEVPSLLSEITRQIENPAGGCDLTEPEFVSYNDTIEDHPEVERAWDSYIEDCWLPWTEKHTEWERIHKAYAALFAIHQEQLRLGEEYELVLGVGLLRWQTSSGQRVRRHLLVSNANLDFEAHLGKFTVRPAPDGACLRPELDMLDIEEQPPKAEDSARQSLAGGADDPWESASTEEVLRTLVHSIGSEGEYHDSLRPPKNGNCEKPVVSFAPAIISRKRSTRGLIDTLKTIQNQIDLGNDLPSEFRDLAEINRGENSGREPEPTCGLASVGGEIFFPRPSNDSQRRIVELSRASSGLLVQGPPGTGKSHTIANLICHLLATGQRTLVTAKTPRALQVLKQLLPEELQPLCINLLGSGQEEKRSLESSVGGVLRKHEHWDASRADETIVRLQDTLCQLREEQTLVERRLRDIREAETHSHSIGDGAYCGTAARIAEAVNRNRGVYEWCAHSAELEKSCPVTAERLRTILAGLRRFTLGKRRELNSVLPVDLPSEEVFAKLAEDERKTSEREQRQFTSADEQLTGQLSELMTPSIEAVRDSFSALRDARRRQAASPYPWLDDVARDIVAGSSDRWRELLQVTTESIAALQPAVACADETHVRIRLADGKVLSSLEQLEAKVLNDDACCLKTHMERGGRLGWWIFRSSVVRERFYLCRSVKVNGHVCDSIEQLTSLIGLLNVHLEIEKTWRAWEGYAERPNGSYGLQLRALDSLRHALEDALSLEAVVEKCRNSLGLSADLREPRWLDESEVERVVTSCQLALVRQDREGVAARLRKIEDSIAAVADRGDVHAVFSELLRAVQDRNARKFVQVSEAFRCLRKEREQLQELDDEVDRLRHTMGGIIETLLETCTEPAWDSRVETIEDAWRWDQARYWVEEHACQGDVSNLTERAQQIAGEIGHAIASLAALRAWSYCFSRLTEDHRRHMEAWQQSMRKLGKGTGKHAPRHRREAQQHLNQCREAVPAWVMPLHRIWDTVEPSPGMFDVVIVDEASQCGLEALPLLYMAKKILIVGDDKQISPDAVGLPLDAVQRLKTEFLSDFQFQNLFDADSSLFDHGKLRYGTRRITLCEHFRCMPEIIRFSNDLCYFDTPLMPLRQYGPDRGPALRGEDDGGGCPSR
jgi:hypothetical protein